MPNPNAHTPPGRVNALSERLNGKCTNRCDVEAPQTTRGLHETPGKRRSKWAGRALSGLRLTSRSISLGEKSQALAETRAHAVITMETM